jgi:hypothetical protein
MLPDPYMKADDGNLIGAVDDEIANDEAAARLGGKPVVLELNSVPKVVTNDVLRPAALQLKRVEKHIVRIERDEPAVFGGWRPRNGFK